MSPAPLLADGPMARGHSARHAPPRVDPPQFGSEVAYVKRHGVLWPAEIWRIKRADYEPETLSVRPPRG